jgi:hypothetical protein
MFATNGVQTCENPESWSYFSYWINPRYFTSLSTVSSYDSSYPYSRIHVYAIRIASIELGRFEWRWLSPLVNETAVVWVGVMVCPIQNISHSPTCDGIWPLPRADAMCDATFINWPNPTEPPAHTCRFQYEWYLVHASKWRYVSQTCFSTCFCCYISKFHMAERWINGTCVCMYVCMHACMCSAYRTRGLTPIKLYLTNTNSVEIIKTSK